MPLNAKLIQRTLRQLFQEQPGIQVLHSEIPSNEAILGASQRGSGCYNGPGVTVTWCIGHLIEAAPPESYGEQYKRWSLEQLPIIPERWRVDIKPTTATQYNVVKSLLTKASELVIATDADREGEMIARELIELSDYRGPIKRLWLSALNDASIRKALGALKGSDETVLMYHSALARSRADWLIGMNLSRLFTVLGRQAGYDGVLSVGRVQTPTLRLVVDRDREIARFVSVPFWVVDVGLSQAVQAFAASWLPPEGQTDAEGRCLNQTAAQVAADRIQAGGMAQVTSVTTERVREVAPLLFDLGTLQEVCSRRFGIDVQETLDIADVGRVAQRPLAIVASRRAWVGPPPRYPRRAAIFRRHPRGKARQRSPTSWRQARCQSSRSTSLLIQRTTPALCAPNRRYLCWRHR